jgi:ATP-dependent protease ClpP protease subunit
MLQVLAKGARRAEVLIHEPIGENWYGNGLTSKQFAADLAALGEIDEILVRINSPGGACFDAISIYNTLKGHGATIEVLVEGLAASAASFIAMAGSKIRVGQGAMFMIHNPWTAAVGDAGDMRDVADMLDKVGESMVDIYQARTKLPRSDIRKIMDAETWLTAGEAIERGFADEHASEEVAPADSSATHRARFQALRAAFAAPVNDRNLLIAAGLRGLPQSQVSSGGPTMPQSREEIFAAERERRAQIRTIATPLVRQEGGQAVLDALLDDPGVSVESAKTRILSELGKHAVPINPWSAPPPGSGGQDFVSAATDALCIRAGIAIEKPHAGAGDIRSMSVLEIARACLSRAGRTHSGFRDGKIIQAALSTSDFPGILENSLGKALRNGYETGQQSHRAWVRKTMVPDFKTQSRLLLGSAPGLERVIELGEYKYGALNENKATLAVLKYGKLLRLSWETLINDDLQAFMRIPQAMGAAAMRSEADVVYAEVFAANAAAGQTMQDGNPLFHSSHANISATVGAISTSTLGAGRALLRKQQALGGGYLNLTPKFLIVAAEDETAAEEVLAKSSRHVADTAASGAKKVDAITPEWISKLQLVVEPRLAAANGFYLAAGSDQIDTVELATLEADGGEPVLEEEQEFSQDARNYKVRHVFVAKAIDWKGMVRVPKT